MPFVPLGEANNPLNWVSEFSGAGAPLWGPIRDYAQKALMGSEGRPQGSLLDILGAIPPVGAAFGAARAARAAARPGTGQAVIEAAKEIGGPYADTLAYSLNRLIGKLASHIPSLVGPGKKLTYGDLQGRALETVMRRLPELVPGISRMEPPDPTTFAETSKAIRGRLMGAVSKDLREDIRKAADAVPLVQQDEALRRLLDRARERLYTRFGEENPPAATLGRLLRQPGFLGPKHKGLAPSVGEVTPGRIDEILARTVRQTQGADTLTQLARTLGLALPPKQEARVLYSQVAEMIDQLPSRQRDVARRMPAYTTREIGEQLGISHTAVQKNLNRALTTLRVQLEGILGRPPVPGGPPRSQTKYRTERTPFGERVLGEPE